MGEDVTGAGRLTPEREASLAEVRSVLAPSVLADDSCPTAGAEAEEDAGE